MGPPAAPVASTGTLSLRIIVGLMLESGLLPPSTLLDSFPIRPKALGTPGRIEKSSISLFISTPVPGMMTLDPNEVLIVDVIETQFPLSSEQQKCVVCLLKKS